MERILTRIIERYDFRRLQKEIESYGYTYSLKNYLLVSLLCLFVIVVISWYIQLKMRYIILLGITILLVIPFIIQSQFRQLYELKRFEMVCSYLDNIIPIFKRTPLIVQTWSELLDLLDGEMKCAVEEALHLVINNTEDSMVIKSAFDKIESRFSNSRIHSVHQMMYTIETKNTKNYVLSIDNLWIDIQSWINRVIIFQKDLKDRKSKLTLISLLTMASNCLFVAMYSSNDVFLSFTDNNVYQISSTFFMIVLIVVMAIFQVKLNGKWLLDDNTEKISNKAKKSFDYIRNNNTVKIETVSYKVLAFILCLLGMFVYFKTGNILLLALLFYLAYMMFFYHKRLYKMHSKSIKKCLWIEFPIWMRDIALNLQNLTVINSIEESMNIVSPIFSYYVNDFLGDYYTNPSSIKPFNDFLREFNIEGVRSSMKVLYSLQSLDREEMQKQTSYLIVRNQEMLAKAERIKNEDAISGLKMLGFIPVGIFIAQMLISMGLLFSVMLNLMNNNIIF